MHRMCRKRLHFLHAVFFFCFSKYMKLLKANDSDDYKNAYEYRVSDFIFAILTDIDPPSTVMENYFPIIIT